MIKDYLPFVIMMLVIYLLAVVGVVVYDLSSYIIGLAGGVTFAMIMYFAKKQEQVSNES